MKQNRLCFALIVGLGSTFAACGGSGSSGTDGGPSGSGGSPATGGQSPSSGGAGGAMGTTDSGGSPASGGSTGATQPVKPETDAASPPGAGGGAGGSAPRDGGISPHDAGSVEPDGAAAASYTCSLILGIATTNEWFGGFEKVVDNARWELKFQDSAHIEKWADPANAVWSLPITSACTQNADKPDRIVFMGTNYDYDSVDLFLPKYIAVLNNIKAKYPTVKHLDVMTYTRGPGNKECVGANRSNDSYIKPAQDEAIAMFAAMYPGVVVPAPKWETASCSDFGLCPHLSGPANAIISKTIGEYFLTH